MADEPQDWTLYETNDEDVGRKLWQIRGSFPDGFDPAAYRNAVIIEWAYGDAGLPDRPTLDALHAFETRLEPLDAPAGNSLLVHIIRGGGLSELCYYAKDTDVFMAALNGVLAGQPRYPINIEFLDDAAWEYRRSIVENLAQ